MYYVIETSGLHYRASGETILHDINLQVPYASIYGFLGPNGAGKTTTIKLLLGLLQKQQGSIHIKNRSFTGNRVALLRGIGALIESPSLYPDLTAREHLLMVQQVYQCPQSRIAEVLQLVALETAANKRVGRFSLGMKQRLAIGMALIHRPSLLILDEPTNGLDPQGIIEIRELLKKLNDERDMTILVSSHMLSEVEKLVSHIGIIHKGRMLYQGPLEGLQSGPYERFTEIRVNNPVKAADIAASLGIRVTVAEDHILWPATEHSLIAGLNSSLVQAGLEVSQIATRNNDLESVFIDLLNTSHAVY